MAVTVVGDPLNNIRVCRGSNCSLAASWPGAIANRPGPGDKTWNRAMDCLYSSATGLLVANRIRSGSVASCLCLVR